MATVKDIFLPLLAITTQDELAGFVNEENLIFTLWLAQPAHKGLHVLVWGKYTLSGRSVGCQLIKSRNVVVIARLEWRAFYRGLSHADAGCG
jgi:hypothetical protein